MYKIGEMISIYYARNCARTLKKKLGVGSKAKSLLVVVHLVYEILSRCLEIYPVIAK